MDQIERVFLVIKIIVFVAGLVPKLATLMHNTEQAWEAATTPEDKAGVIIAALEDLLASLRSAL